MISGKLCVINWSDFGYVKDGAIKEIIFLSVVKELIWSSSKLSFEPYTRRKLSTNVLFSIYFLCLCFPACLNHELFKTSDFYQSLLNILLYSVVFFPPSWKEQADLFWYFYTFCFIVFLQCFLLDAKVQMLWLLLLAQDICFSVGPFLSFILNYNLYVHC